MKFGVTDPMSKDPPTPRDLKLDEALLQELKGRNEFEAQEETNRRCDLGHVQEYTDLRLTNRH